MLYKIITHWVYAESIKMELIQVKLTTPLRSTQKIVHFQKKNQLNLRSYEKVMILRISQNENYGVSRVRIYFENSLHQNQKISALVQSAQENSPNKKNS